MKIFSLRFHYTINNRIKLGAKVKSSACLRTKDGMNLDYFIIYGIIVYISCHTVHMNSSTSFDLKCLLDILRSKDPAGNKIIICYNASPIWMRSRRESFHHHV